MKHIIAFSILVLFHASSSWAQQLSDGEVDAFLNEWISTIEHFDFDAFAKLIDDSAEITLTHPISREVQHFTKDQYIASLRPLAETYIAYDYTIQTRSIAIEGSTATITLRGIQKVTHVKGTITRGMSAEFIVKKVEGQLLMIKSVTVPDEKAEYHRT